MRNSEAFVISVGDFQAKIRQSNEDNLYVEHLILDNQKHSACFSAKHIGEIWAAMKEAVTCYFDALDEFGEEGYIMILL